MHWIAHVSQEAPPQGAIKIVTGCKTGLVVDVLSWLDGSADVTHDARRVDCAGCLVAPAFNVARLEQERLAEQLAASSPARPCPWCDQAITPGHTCSSTLLHLEALRA